MSKRITLTLVATLIAIIAGLGAVTVLANSELKRTYASLLSDNAYLINNALLTPELESQLLAADPAKQSWIDNSLTYFDTLREIDSVSQEAQKLTTDQIQLQRTTLQKKLDLTSTFTLDNPDSEATPVLQNTIITIQTILNNPQATLAQLSQANELVSENNAYFQTVLDNEMRKQYFSALENLKAIIEEQIVLSSQNNNVGIDELRSLGNEVQERLQVPDRDSLNGRESLVWTTNAQIRVASVKQAIQVEQERIAAEIKAREEERKRKEEEAARFAAQNNITFKHILIDISDQTMYRFEGNTLLDSSPLVSGKPGFDTVRGKYAIFAKQRNTYLVSPFQGISYRVFVNYWMPFYSGYGIHDAPWRSEFGGNIYTYNGSHGCANTPPEYARLMFEWAEIGTTVQVVD